MQIPYTRTSREENELFFKPCPLFSLFLSKAMRVHMKSIPWIFQGEGLQPLDEASADVPERPQQNQYINNCKSLVFEVCSRYMVC